MPTTLVPEEDATLGWRTDFDDVYKRGEMIGSSAFGQVSGMFPGTYYLPVSTPPRFSL